MLFCCLKDLFEIHHFDPLYVGVEAGWLLMSAFLQYNVYKGHDLFKCGQTYIITVYRHLAYTAPDSDKLTNARVSCVCTLVYTYMIRYNGLTIVAIIIFSEILII